MRAKDLLNYLASFSERNGPEHFSRINPWLASLVWPLSGGPSLLREYANSEGNLARLWGTFSAKFRRPPEEYLQYLNRVVQAVHRIKLKGEDVLDVEYKTRTRFLVGFGASAWESGVQLLPPFGVPWIPGSSLKGRMEHVYTLELISDRPELAEYLGFKEKRRSYKDLPEKDLPADLRELAHLFGTKERKGSLKIIGGFLSWSGEEGRIFDVDVVTPHYPSYYRSSSKEYPPGDWDRPIPFFFPIVSRGVVFRFLLVFPEEYRKKVFDLLDRTLRFYGVGGKTGSGYGLFEPIRPG